MFHHGGSLPAAESFVQMDPGVYPRVQESPGTDLLQGRTLHALSGLGLRFDRAQTAILPAYRFSGTSHETLGGFSSAGMLLDLCYTCTS